MTPKQKRALLILTVSWLVMFWSGYFAHWAFTSVDITVR